MIAILNVETSTDVCSVAIAIDGKTIALQESFSPNSHTEKLTLLIQSCLKEANMTLQELDAVSVSDGPGSYTSLRIGAATVKAMCYALDKPLISVDSLTILASGISPNILNPEDIIISMIDARRNEVYASVFDFQSKKLSDIAPVILDENPFEHLSGAHIIYICGNGAEKYYNQYNNSAICLQHTFTSARFMETITYKLFQNNQFESVAYFSPDYIKSPNITKSTKKLF
ncbi:MAG TPA: tRNA (adenosine(37)-N6)-threonylcarbamoyltransferase complex dimerization subunit type 1 TsaB [Saprospiraceae bacterium]|nr:tRNA (adenosine(37)-N6)-threonylcarbamoyltransferase complex dimerization subunit type 1 TsaB [Saprospiraceae bacterium]HRO07605.1 tRNA (adenosine(37)-N6)-threonylcarbamoyltransferase complex dimerization subunit type 1 TsaB [Saprospiraceae bacterium]HRO72041.1 tRNA (adenosine(37)-N6)-threonylcarbamoyltransferase complex dimerization subunit type 1 TsaB [Saprospiraceae bacterium]HRP40888.1 tRNA (adenosine(37)-N6)-threonylcarbamoyltransferase complex dimerization subunit type 1 TsaB [Saprospir